VRTLDSGFRRNDQKNAFSTFYESIIIDAAIKQMKRFPSTCHSCGARAGLDPVAGIQALQRFFWISRCIHGE
jgi:hypothetical protein